MQQTATTTDWLVRVTAEEDNGAVSVGGFFERIELAPQESPSAAASLHSLALARLVEFSRRDKRWTISDLAAASGLDLSELVLIEQGKAQQLEPGAIFKLSQALGLPMPKLLVASGLALSRDPGFDRATLRFVAQSENVQLLSKEEHNALEEFVRFLAED